VLTGVARLSAREIRSSGKSQNVLE